MAFFYNRFIAPFMNTWDFIGGGGIQATCIISQKLDTNYILYTKAKLKTIFGPIFAIIEDILMRLTPFGRGSHWVLKVRPCHTL